MNWGQSEPMQALTVGAGNVEGESGMTIAVHARRAFSPLAVGEHGAAIAPAAPGSAAHGVHELAASMLGFVRGVEAFRHQFARRVKVSDTEIRALGRIAEAGSITPKKLADALELTTGTVTSLIDRLESIDLIARAPNPRDRRSILLALTPDGLATMTEMYDLFQRVLLESVGDLPAEVVSSTGLTLGRSGEALATQRMSTRRSI